VCNHKVWILIAEVRVKKYKFEQPNNQIRKLTVNMKKRELEIAAKLAELLELPQDVVAQIVEIMKSTTISQIKDLYEKAPKESLQQAIAGRKWDRLTYQDISKAETAEEFAVAYAEAREDSEASYSAMEGVYEHALAKRQPWKVSRG